MDDIFEQRIADWNGLREPDKTAFYEQELWSEVCQRFARHTPTERFDVLAVPVSNPYTALLHLQHYKPETAVFIYSERSHKDHAERLRQETAKLGIQYDETEPPINATDPVQVYQAVLQVIDRYPGKRIAVDITGGTKAMSVGVAMAGSLVGATSVYIESKFSSPQQRTPGTEQPHLLPDPYNVLGDLVRRRAQSFFRAHDYATAHELFSELAQRIEPPQGDAAYALLAAAYRDWDAFNLSAACDQMRTLVGGPLPVPMEAARPTLTAQAAALEMLAYVAPRASGQGAQALETLGSHTAALALLGALHANALRREAQGRYDMAALLGYRCLELISQHRLATKGVLTEKPDKDTLDQLFQEHGVPQNKQGSFRGRLALFVGYKLLRELRDPLVQGYNIEQINQRSRARNTSILAHGYRLITRQEYQHFAAVVHEMIGRLFEQIPAKRDDAVAHEMIDRLLALIPADRADWEQTYTFVQPFGAP